MAVSSTTRRGNGAGRGGPAKAFSATHQPAPATKAIGKEAMATARAVAIAHAVEAAMVRVDIMRSAEDERLRLEAARQIIDQAEPPVKHSVTATINELSGKSSAELARVRTEVDARLRALDRAPNPGTLPS